MSTTRADAATTERSNARRRVPRGGRCRLWLCDALRVRQLLVELFGEPRQLGLAAQLVEAHAALGDGAILALEIILVFAGIVYKGKR